MFIKTAIISQYLHSIPLSFSTHSCHLTTPKILQYIENSHHTHVQYDEDEWEWGEKEMRLYNEIKKFYQISLTLLQYWHGMAIKVEKYSKKCKLLTGHKTRKGSKKIPILHNFYEKGNKMRTRRWVREKFNLYYYFPLLFSSFHKRMEVSE